MQQQGKIITTTAYTWSSNDILGRGAFGQVYKGIDRQGSREVAIKTFEKTVIRVEEIELLKRVKHKNIVRLYATDSQAHGRTIMIMELCNAGNLHNMLEDPENNYGFEEEDFKLILSHITDGMKVLYDENIVHRDLKPGNIMRTISDSGEVVYKLTDFGAARELKETEQFTSLCGTQEYLHPDMYAAFLKMPTTNRFGACIDLWSLGVTLYHIATGALPFRPYGGVRKNMQGMMQITSKKPSEAISGSQNEDGEIEWGFELPKTCCFSQSFREEIVSILKGILEHDTQKIWTFERYFKEVDDLLKKRIVHVFSMSSSSYQPLYITNENSLSALEDKMVKYFRIPIYNQLILFDGRILEKSSTIISDLPVTTSHQPLILFSCDIKDLNPSIPIPHTCKPPKVKADLTYENDANLARVCASTLYNIEKSVKYLALVEHLIKLAAKWFISYMRSCLHATQLKYLQLSNKHQLFKTSILCFEQHYRRETSLLKLVLGQSSEMNPLIQLFTDILQQIKNLKKIEEKFDKIEKVTHEVEEILTRDTYRSITISCDLFDATNFNQNAELAKKILAFAEKSREIFHMFRKHRQLVKNNQRSKFTEHEFNIHVFHKSKLSEICKSSVQLFTSESVPACKRLHKESQNWFPSINKLHLQLKEADEMTSSLGNECVELSDKFRMLQRGYWARLEKIELILKKPSSDVLCTTCDDDVKEMKSSTNLTQKVMLEIKEATETMKEIQKDLDINEISIQKLEQLTK